MKRRAALPNPMRILAPALVAVLLAASASKAHAQPAPPPDPAAPPPASAPPASAPPAVAAPAEPGWIEPAPAAPPADVPPAPAEGASLPADASAPGAAPGDAPSDAPAVSADGAAASPQAPSPDASSPRDTASDTYDHLPKYHQYDLGFEAGARFVAAADPSFDPYSTGDALTSFALAVTWLPLARGPLSVGAIGEWSVGGASGDARGAPTSVTVHRAALGAQGRLALGQRVYLHAKVVPSAVFATASIDDAAVDRSLDATQWTWGVDAAGGAAVLIGRAGHPEAPAFRLWIVGELGYAFTGAADMVHTPEEDEDDPRTYGKVALAPLSTDGVLSRLAVAMTF